jgi:hypothetical protein
MLKLSLRFYLFLSILTIAGMCIVHGQFSMTFLRVVSIIFLSSLCAVPGILFFNAIFSFIRSIKQGPIFSWMIFVTIILFFNNLVVNTLVWTKILDWNNEHSLLLVVNSSSFVVLVLQFASIHHLFKTFTYEKEQPLTLG